MSLVVQPARFSPLALPAGAVMPVIVAACGEGTAWRGLEFCSVSTRNQIPLPPVRERLPPFSWCDALGLAMQGIQPVHVAA